MSAKQLVAEVDGQGPWEALLKALQLDPAMVASRLPPGSSVEETLRPLLARLTDGQRRVLSQRFGLVDGQPRTPRNVVLPRRSASTTYRCPRCGSIRAPDEKIWNYPYHPRLSAKSTRCINGHRFDRPRTEVSEAGTPVSVSRVRQLEWMGLYWLRRFIALG